MSRKNLEILYSVLTKPLPHHFDMWTYFRGGITEDYPCGTVACALGSLPMAIPREADEHWNKYSARVLGINEGEEVWCWLFSSNWHYVDNTQAGAAARIRYLLDYDLPADWEDQMDGAAELCYLHLVRPI